jgi:isoleucyl-tRNA synthetase
MERRSSQTCLFWILDIMTRLLAPILSFLVEEVFDEYKVNFFLDTF